MAKSNRVLAAAGTVLVVITSSAASAAPITTAPSGELTFTGTVQYVRGDTISVSNPGGTTTSIASSDVPAYLFEPGATVSTTIRFDPADPAFANAGCGGNFNLVSASSVAGACDIAATVSTPFGTTSMGGTGGDAGSFLRGLGIVQDPVTGELAVKVDASGYSLGWVGVNPYFWDSQSQTLSGPTSVKCVSSFDCLAGVGTGTLDSLSFLIPIAGDYGTYRPGYNVGYAAGSAGTMTITGAFSFGGSSGSVNVPEPPIAVLVAFTLLALGGLRRRQVSYARVNR